MRRQLLVNFLRLLLFFTLFFCASVPGWAQAARGYPDELLTLEFPRNSLHALDYPITKNRSEELMQVRNSAGTIIAAPNSTPADFLEDAARRNLDLSWSKLNNLIIGRYNPKRVTLKGMKLACSDFSLSSIGATDFVSCDLRAAKFDKVVFSTNVNFTDCNLQGASFKQSWGCGKFNRCAMQGANFSQSQCRPGLFSSCNLEDADFTGCNVENVAFVNTELNRANFKGATLSYVNIASCPVKDISVDAATDRQIRANGSWGRTWHEGDPGQVAQAIPTYTPSFHGTHSVSIANYFTIHMQDGKSVIFSSQSVGFGNDPNRRGWVEWVRYLGQHLSGAYQPNFGGGIHAQMSIAKTGIISIKSFRDYRPEVYHWKGKRVVKLIPNGELLMQNAVRNAVNTVNKSHRVSLPSQNGVERVSVEMIFGGYPSRPGSTVNSLHPVD